MSACSRHGTFYGETCVPCDDEHRSRGLREARERSDDDDPKDLTPLSAWKRVWTSLDRDKAIEAAAPSDTDWTLAAVPIGRSYPQSTGGQMMNRNACLTQNARGEWVPGIPLPFYFWWKQRVCGDCKRKFRFWRTQERYEEHYALAHILKPAPEPTEH
jgi:hypothetical protein